LTSHPRQEGKVAQYEVTRKYKQTSIAGPGAAEAIFRPPGKAHPRFSARIWLIVTIVLRRTGSGVAVTIALHNASERFSLVFERPYQRGNRFFMAGVP
jgi:hypothetical protein